MSVGSYANPNCFAPVNLVQAFLHDQVEKKLQSNPDFRIAPWPDWLDDPVYDQLQQDLDGAPVAAGPAMTDKSNAPKGNPCSICGEVVAPFGLQEDQVQRWCRNCAEQYNQRESKKPLLTPYAWAIDLNS
eukprot:SAG31_NODE_840_length_11596_cov_3.056623_6_plen_130_part_00